MWRFSLRSLIIPLTILCVALAVIAFWGLGLPEILIGAAWINWIVVAALLAATLHGRGSTRAGAVGALIPTAAFGCMTLFNRFYPNDEGGSVVLLVIAYATALIANRVCLRVHRYVTGGATGNSETGRPAVVRPGATGSSAPDSLQFGVGQLFAIISVLSLVLAIVFAFPDWLASAAVIVASISLVAALTIAVVYAPGQARAFCIGALFPATLVAVAAAILFVAIAFDWRFSVPSIRDRLNRSAGGLRFAMVAGWLMAFFIGTLSVIVRRYLSRDRAND
jgi:hypothetical protein